MPRKSKAQLAGESALGNLNCILELMDEARELQGSREANAIAAHHAVSCSRWVDAIRAADMALPERVERNAAHFASVGWLPPTRRSR